LDIDCWCCLLIRGRQQQAAERKKSFSPRENIPRQVVVGGWVATWSGQDQTGWNHQLRVCISFPFSNHTERNITSFQILILIKCLFEIFLITIYTLTCCDHY